MHKTFYISRERNKKFMWYIVELYEHLGGNNTQEVSENHSLTAHDPFKASYKFFKHSCVYI